MLWISQNVSDTATRLVQFSGNLQDSRKHMRTTIYRYSRARMQLYRNLRYRASSRRSDGDEEHLPHVKRAGRNNVAQQWYCSMDYDTGHKAFIRLWRFPLSKAETATNGASCPGGLGGRWRHGGSKDSTLRRPCAPRERLHPDFIGFRAGNEIATRTFQRRCRGRVDPMHPRAGVSHNGSC